MLLHTHTHTLMEQHPAMSIKFTLKLHFELISLGAAMCKTLLQQLCECMCVSSATVTVSPLGELLALQNT